MNRKELESIEQILEEYCLNYGNYDVCKQDCRYFELCEKWQAETLKAHWKSGNSWK